MPESRALPLFRWGEEMRRRRHAALSHKRGLGAAAFTGALAAALCFTVTSRPLPRLVWNASASSPEGLYWVTPGEVPWTGAIVAAWPPAQARRLAERRHYLPARVPLVKRVAAEGGDRVCAARDRLIVNGRTAVHRRPADGAGRPLPWWTGCRDLRAGQFLLLGSTADSFDGRYFGVTEGGDVIGIATLLWRK